MHDQANREMLYYTQIQCYPNAILVLKEFIWAERKKMTQCPGLNEQSKKIMQKGTVKDSSFSVLQTC